MNLKFWKILSLSILQNMWKCVLNITLRMWLNNHLIRRLLWIWIGHFSQSQEWRWDYTTGQYYFVPKGAETQWKRKKKKSFWIFIGWVNRAVWLWRSILLQEDKNDCEFILIVKAVFLVSKGGVTASISPGWDAADWSLAGRAAT